jgi:hypothetical protein
MILMVKYCMGFFEEMAVRLRLIFKGRHQAKGKPFKKL